VSEETGNARFATPGTPVYMQIQLNNGAGGTFVLHRVRCTGAVTVLNFGATADANTGTAIHGNSGATAKNFVMLYDNTAGTGQPLTGTFVESDGVAENTSTSYATFYSTLVDGISGAWGAIIPNVNGNGVRRIEQRTLSDGSLLWANTAALGAWPSGANTVSPTGGDTTPIGITASDAPLAPVITSIQVTGGNVLIDFIGQVSDTTSSYTVWRTADLTTPLTSISAGITSSGPGLFQATVTGATAPSFYRIRRP
jgi:hypothetical protein